jgi:hypothetical protein
MPHGLAAQVVSLVAEALEAEDDDAVSDAEKVAVVSDHLTKCLEIANGQRLQAISMGFDEAIAQQMGYAAYGSFMMRIAGA